MVDMMVDLVDPEFRFLGEIGILSSGFSGQSSSNNKWEIMSRSPDSYASTNRLYASQSGELRQNNIWSRQCALAEASVFPIAGDLPVLSLFH